MVSKADPILYVWAAEAETKWAMPRVLGQVTAPEGYIPYSKPLFSIFDHMLVGPKLLNADYKEAIKYVNGVLFVDSLLLVAMQQFIVDANPSSMKRKKSRIGVLKYYRALKERRDKRDSRSLGEVGEDNGEVQADNGGSDGD